MNIQDYTRHFCYILYKLSFVAIHILTLTYALKEFQSQNSVLQNCVEKWKNNDKICLTSVLLQPKS